MRSRMRCSALFLLLAALTACEAPEQPLGPEPGPEFQVPSAYRFGAPDAVVTPGTSIQAALDAAEPGDVIFVRPGVYRESVRIDKPDITLVGLGRRLGSRGAGIATLENPGAAGNGIVVTSNGSGVRLMNMVVRGFDRNGVLLVGLDGFLLSEMVAEDNGAYGLFPVRTRNGVIERSVASGHSDTGIYIGQSEHVVIRRSIAFGNVNGFEIENSSHILARENRAYGNTAGFLVVLLPGLAVTESSDIILERNHSYDNNLPNFAYGGFEQFVPAGSGILVVGTDATTVRDNTVTGNEFVGIALANTGILAELAGVPIAGIEPFPDGTRIVSNTVQGNGGAQPIPILPPGVDLLWDGTGTDNCWSENEFDSSLNLDLPGGMPGAALPACD